MSEQATQPTQADAQTPNAVFHNVLEMVGNTPLLEVSRLAPGDHRLFLKMESQNPAGSIKDRIGVSMIEAAERDGRIDRNADPPPTIIEATAGNTGLGLALVAGQRGYKLLVVVPDKMSREKVQHLRAMGAAVIMTRSDVTKGHPEYYQDIAARIASETPNSVYINQFANEANAQAHYTTTGPEIFGQMGGDIDAFVVGVGSGGTLSGTGRLLKERCPDCRIILADPAGSVLWPRVNEGKEVEPGAWLIEGMGEDFIPPVCDLDLVDEAIPVTDEQAFHAARRLLKVEGVLAGSSTGCLLFAAIAWLEKQREPKRLVTFACDQGAKYLSKMFNDFWMMDQGFLERECFGDLRDLIARRHLSREDFTLAPSDSLQRAVNVMKLYDVSQVAVVERDRAGADHCVGIIDEGDVLLAATRDKSAFEAPVADFMTRRLETIKSEAKVDDLLPIFRADRVAIVEDDAGQFLGLITKIDLINYLRGQLARD